MTATVPGIVDITYEVVAISTVTTHVIPALIWVLVMFRRSDWVVNDETTPRVIIIKS
ncbi:MAG: hypothetical protein IH987_15605 [Planctomycetes bacterium]|nr:hypothetical protein [Planctomycetota bacterium]